MKFARQIYSRRSLAVLDFGSERVIMLIGEKKQDGSFEILGAGDSKTQGIENGEITHLGDAVEATVEAIQKAEKTSGRRAETVYFNYDDAEMRSLRCRGSKILKGEGEIQLSDIQEVCQTAERFAGHFEKNIVYSKAVSFLIDDRDVVSNPIGVFGRKLDAFVHILQARSQNCELWQKLMERSEAPKAALVFSGWSTAYGVLPKEDRQKKRLILDLGNDFINVLVFENGMISDYRCLSAKEISHGELPEKVAEVVKEFLSADSGVEQVSLTGDLAEKEEMVQSLRNTIARSLHRASPFGVPKLASPRFSSLVGLLAVADELERKVPMLYSQKGLFVSVKDKAVSFINEYF